MRRDVLRLKLEVDLEHLKPRLEHALKALRTDAERALEDLTAGGHRLDTRLIGNKTDVDVMSSEYNRITEMLSLMDVEEKEPAAPAVSSPPARVPRGGGRRP